MRDCILLQSGLLEPSAESESKAVVPATCSEQKDATEGWSSERGHHWEPSSAYTISPRPPYMFFPLFFLSSLPLYSPLAGTVS